MPAGKTNTVRTPMDNYTKRIGQCESTTGSTLFLMHLILS